MVAVVASQLDPAAGIRFDALGFGLALGAALSQTVFVVVSRDGYPTVPTEQAMIVVLGVTVVGATVAGAGRRPRRRAWSSRSRRRRSCRCCCSPASSPRPSRRSGFLTGIRAIGGTRAGILMLFEPVVGVALAAWLLGEDLVPLQVVGALAILGAAIILQRGSRRDDGVDPSGRDARHAGVAAGDESGPPSVVVPGGP